MNLRNSRFFRSIASILAASMLLFGLPAGARAQVVPGLPSGEVMDRPAPSANVTMSVTVPSDTEAVQAERPAINPMVPPPVLLEQPIDPDKYICGGGDIVELNFWGR